MARSGEDDVFGDVEEKSVGREAFLKTIGERLRMARMAAGMTQRDVADAVGVSAAYIGIIENGRQNISLWGFHRVTNAVGLSMEDVLMGAAPTESKSLRSVEAIAGWMENLLKVFEEWLGREKERAEWVKRMDAEVGRLREEQRKLLRLSKKRN